LGKYVYHVDPREVGSGATGATNTARAMGPAAGIITAVIDVFKGWIALYFAQHYLVPAQVYGQTAMQWALGIALFAVIAGHAYSPWLQFRGGKGVAVAGGAALALWAPLFFVELGIVVVIALLSGFVGLGSVIAALALPLLIGLFATTRHIPLIVSGALAGLFVVWLHRENIRRLLKGEENKLTLGRRSSIQERERDE